MIRKRPKGVWITKLPKDKGELTVEKVSEERSNNGLTMEMGRIEVLLSKQVNRDGSEVNDEIQAEEEIADNEI